MKKVLFIIFFLLFIIVTSCGKISPKSDSNVFVMQNESSTSSEDESSIQRNPLETKAPKNSKFAANIEKLNNIKEYRLEYVEKIYGPNTTYGSDFDVRTYVNVEIVKKGDKEKVLNEITSGYRGPGTLIIYKDSGTPLTCTNRSYGLRDKSKLTCERSELSFHIIKDDYEMSNIGRNLKSSYNAIYVGEETILGRSCERFIVPLTGTGSFFDYSNSIGGDPHSASSYFFSEEQFATVCFDKQLGIPLNYEVFTQEKGLSPIKDHKKTDLFKLEVKSASDKVNDEIFDPPVKFIILGSNWEEKEITIAIEPIYDFFGDLTAEVDNIKGISPISIPGRQYLKGKIELVRFSYDSNLKFVKYNLCYERNCQNIDWYDDNCIEKSIDQEKCKSDKGCIFIDGYCTTFFCELLKEEKDCLSNKICDWYSDEPDSTYYHTCVDKSCHEISEKDCETSPGCMWDVSCKNRYCHNLESKESCERKDMYCYWKKTGPGSPNCMHKNCFNFDTKEDCELSELRCIWDNPAGNHYCSPNDCTNIVNKDKCEKSDLGCAWSTERKSCF